MLYAMAMSEQSFCLFVCLFVRLSPVKSVKSFATWQHLAEFCPKTYNQVPSTIAILSKVL